MLCGGRSECGEWHVLRCGIFSQRPGSFLFLFVGITTVCVIEHQPNLVYVSKAIGFASEGPRELLPLPATESKIITKAT